MEAKGSPFYVFGTHREAEEAIQALNRSGFDIKKLSLVEDAAKVRPVQQASGACKEAA